MCSSKVCEASLGRYDYLGRVDGARLGGQPRASAEGNLDSTPFATCWCPGAEPYAVIVSEFFTHGELSPDGQNLAVFPRTACNRWPAACCRSGRATPAGWPFRRPPARMPTKSATAASVHAQNPALDQQRRAADGDPGVRPCNLSDFDSVKRAFREGPAHRAATMWKASSIRTTPSR